MKYITKEKHPQKPLCANSCIVTWASLESYLTDCDELSYAPHGKPNTRKMRLPDPSILKRIQNFTTQLNTSEFINTRTRTMDVSGGSLDVATYLSGVPECFSRIVPRKGNDIRVVFRPEVHVDSDDDALYIRGAAILSLIDSLESKGNRVELWLGWDNTVAGQKYESRILAKRSTDYLNVTALAAVCCDASFLRTCEFNLIHHFLHTEGVGRNYGITLPGDVVISGRYDEMAHFRTLTSCEKWIDSMKNKLQDGEGKIQ